MLFWFSVTKRSLENGFGFLQWSEMPTLPASLKIKGHFSTAAAFGNSVFFKGKILSDDRRLYLHNSKWNSRSDVDGLTHTKQLLNLLCIVYIPLMLQLAWFLYILSLDMQTGLVPEFTFPWCANWLGSCIYFPFMCILVWFLYLLSLDVQTGLVPVYTFPWCGNWLCSCIFFPLMCKLAWFLYILPFDVQTGFVPVYFPLMWKLAWFLYILSFDVQTGFVSCIYFPLMCKLAWFLYILSFDVQTGFVSCIYFPLMCKLAWFLYILSFDVQTGLVPVYFPLICKLAWFLYILSFDVETGLAPVYTFLWCANSLDSCIYFPLMCTSFILVWLQPSCDFSPCVCLILFWFGSYWAIIVGLYKETKLWSIPFFFS